MPQWENSLKIMWESGIALWSVSSYSRKVEIEQYCSLLVFVNILCSLVFKIVQRTKFTHEIPWIQHFLPWRFYQFMSVLILSENSWQLITYPFVENISEHLWKRFYVKSSLHFYNLIWNKIIKPRAVGLHVVALAFVLHLVSVCCFQMVFLMQYDVMRGMWLVVFDVWIMDLDIRSWLAKAQWSDKPWVLNYGLCPSWPCTGPIPSVLG